MPDKVILLVEDNPDDQELTLRALKKHKVPSRIIVIQDGADALHYLFREGAYAQRPAADNPDIILLDLNLPKLDGLQVLERLRNDPRTRKTPVVILTSSIQPQDIDSAYALGVNSYLQKSIDSNEFHETVGKLAAYWLNLNVSPIPPRTGLNS